MSELTYEVREGSDAGLILTPHVHRDNLRGQHDPVCRKLRTSSGRRVPVALGATWVQRAYECSGPWAELDPPVIHRRLAADH